MRSDRIAAWLVLLVAGTTMVSYNLWHGFHSGMPGYLALLDGTVPVLLALGLSHMVARRGRFLKIVTLAVMVGAMVLSVRATGYGVRPATGGLWWLFGAVVDTAALVALQVILTPAPVPLPAPAPVAAPEPAPAATQERSPRPAPKRAGSGRRSAPADDLTLEARALELLGKNPKMSGSALGRELGVNESYGRKLRNRLVSVDDSNAGSMT